MSTRTDEIIDSVISGDEIYDVIKRYFYTRNPKDLCDGLERLYEAEDVSRTQRQDEDASEAYKQQLEEALCDE